MMKLFLSLWKSNRHNTQICGTENPKVVKEKERDTPKLDVWYTISSKGIVGPYFFVMMPEEPQMSQKKTIWKAPKVFPPRAEK